MARYLEHPCNVVCLYHAVVDLEAGEVMGEVFGEGDAESSGSGDQLQLFYNHLKKIKGLSDRTVYHYLSYHKHFWQKDLTQRTITLFISSKNNNSVVRGYMKAWLEFLGRHKEFDLPIAKTGTVKRRLVRDISRSEMEKIILCAYDDNRRDGLICDFIYWGALRRSEVCTIKINAVKWEQFFEDPDQHCEFSVIGKGNKERTVLVHPRSIKEILKIFIDRGTIRPTMEVWDILETLNAIDLPLFSKISERSIYGKAKKYAIKSIQRPIRTHEIRHARATHLEEDGASIRDIQKYLGHSHVGTTEIYLHSKESESLKRIKGISNDL